ncbi:MAG: lytic transglycosylase domain-containing protein [Chitinophagales bacterium]
MKARNSIVVVVLLLGLSWVILSATNSFQKLSYTSLNETDEVIGDADIDKISVRNNETFGVKLPQNISFAGEAVPMHDMDVRESLDRELIVNSYWHSSTILMLKRAYRWLPIIEPILRENGVPDDFKYLAMAESGLQDVVSPAGASGFWQFLKSAGKENGLVINSEVDERYHVEKATEAACKYLKQAHDKFGSWTMAAASYNMGMTGLQNQIDRQKQSNYYDLLLNSETGRYVYRILAIKSIHTAPLDFGFNLDPSDMYQPYPYKVFLIDNSVPSWPDFCAQNNITYKDLKMLNPWLREANLTNSENREYKIKVLEK